MIASLRNVLQPRWQALSSREQSGVLTAGMLLACVLGWQLLIAPAQNKLRQADAQRHVIAQQLAHMQTLQAQAQALQQRTPLSRDSALKTLQSLTTHPTMQLTPQGERVTVTLKAVPAQVLSEWLTQARTQAQSLPSEVHLTRAPTNNAVTTMATSASAQTPSWDGHLVLVLPRGANSGAP